MVRGKRYFVAVEDTVVRTNYRKKIVAGISGVPKRGSKGLKPHLDSE